MKKLYKQSDKLQKYIDWDNIMKMERYAGGHDCQMQGLFKNSKVIAHWNEGDYQGEVATCIHIEKGIYKGKFIIYNDYYGSCCGCDAWEDASDEEVKNMCIGLSNGAYIFKSLEDVVSFLSSENKDDYSWKGNVSFELLQEINKSLANAT